MKGKKVYNQQAAVNAKGAVRFSRGAEITLSDFWGKRRFAYEIDHLNEGYYAVTQFKAEPEALEVVDRALSLSDMVIRHKFVRPE